MEEKTGFIYIWYDRSRRMFYIGCHCGTEDDGYICSSKRMRDAYRRRPFDFKRRIIQRNIPKYKLLEAEQKWLALIPDEELGNKYYNHCKNVQNFFLTERPKKDKQSVRDRQSQAAKNRDTTPYKNRMSVMNKVTGWRGKIDCKDFDPLIYESLVCRTDKKVTVIDENGNSFAVTKEEYQANKDRLKTHSSIFNKGRQPTGGGDACKGTIPVYTSDGTCIRVPKDDPRVLSGEYVAQASRVHQGRICINNGKTTKKIYPEELPKYEGWVRGMLPRKEMNT